MKLIVKWDESAKISGRTYLKGCMKIENDISDILLQNLSGDTTKIGKCRIVSDEFGLWATDIEYFVDEKALDDLLVLYPTKGKGTTDLALACMADDKPIIKSATYSDVRRFIFTEDNIGVIIRDLKISSIMCEEI